MKWKLLIKSEFRQEINFNGKPLMWQRDEEAANTEFHNNDGDLLRNCCGGNTGNCEMTINVFICHEYQNIFLSMKNLPECFLWVQCNILEVFALCVFFACVCKWFRVELRWTCKIVWCWQRSLSRHAAISMSQTVYSWSSDQSQMLCAHSSAPRVFWQVVFHTVWIWNIQNALKLSQCHF